MEQIKFVEDSQVMATNKLVSIGNFKQLEVSSRLRHEQSCMYIVNMASGCTREEASFGFLDDLDNISIFLDEPRNASFPYSLTNTII